MSRKIANAPKRRATKQPHAKHTHKATPNTRKTHAQNNTKHTRRNRIFIRSNNRQTMPRNKQLFDDETAKTFAGEGGLRQYFKLKSEEEPKKRGRPPKKKRTKKQQCDEVPRHVRKTPPELIVPISDKDKAPKTVEVLQLWQRMRLKQSSTKFIMPQGHSAWS